MAVIVKVAVCPWTTVWFEGCVVITGGAMRTVSVALLLITLPPALLTTHENIDPLSAMIVGGVV
jgi:hypothetical protein